MLYPNTFYVSSFNKYFKNIFDINQSMFIVFLKAFCDVYIKMRNDKFAIKMNWCIVVNPLYSNNAKLVAIKS